MNIINDNVSIKFLATSGSDIKLLFDTAVDTLSTGSPHTWTNRYISEEWQVNGGEGKCSDTSLKSREECLQNVDLFGNTNKWSMHEIGNLAKLFPNKIALFLNCNKTNGVRGDEVLYHYNPSVQLLYNPADSSLKLRWIDATYSETAYQQKCLFPLLSNEENYKSEVLTIVPSSAVGDKNVPGDSIWEDNVLAFNFIRKNCLLDNKDLHRLIHNIDSSIRKCELAHQSLKLKLKSADTEMGIDAFDPVNSGLY